MSNIHVSSRLDYTVQSPTYFVFSVACAKSPHQKILEENLRITPEIPYEWCTLGEEGNRGIRLQAEPGNFSLEYNAKVELMPEIDSPPQLDEVSFSGLPPEVLHYLNPSRYCESDRLMRFAFQEFGEMAPGYSRVEAICNWVNRYLEYIAGSTDASSSACDVLLQRSGVCRDFAHVSIALCRALGIPARYVAGYAVNLTPPDFHGFFEAFLENRWYLFDATRMAPVSGFVRIGTGRDAADAPFANLVGAATLQNMQVNVSSEEAPQPDVNIAVSTA